MMEGSAKTPTGEAVQKSVSKLKNKEKSGMLGVFKKICHWVS